MITEENLKKLYEEVIKGTQLTTKELNSYGFNSKDLKKLIDENQLERIKKGLYNFIDSKTLYDLGKQAISVKDFDEANLYFEKCYELDNTNKKALFSIFVKSIKDKKYDKSVKYYELLNKNANIYYKTDYNTYIFLLNTITELPTKLKEYTKSLTIKDIAVISNDKRYKDILIENKIRKNIINKNLKFALKQLNDLISNQKETTIHNVILRTLIIDAIEKEKLDMEKILELTQTKQYQKIIYILKEKNKKENLSILEEYIIKLSKIIINIKANKQILQKTIEETDNVYAAIEGNNYELALNLSIDKSKKYNLDNTNNIIYILLLEISNLIKEIEKEKKNQEEQEKKKNIQLTDIINCLMKNDIGTALTGINDYLTNKNQTEYEYLITNLIKLGILEHDITFYKAIIVLININRNSYQFDVSKYIEEFYIALSQNKFEEAKLYLNIINHSKNIGQPSICTENLSKLLVQTQETINQKKLVKQIENETEPVVKKNKNSVKEEESTVEISDSEKQFLEAKYNLLLENKGAILLKPMDKERRERVYSVLDNYKDIVTFSIGAEEPKQIVIRYKPYYEEYVDIPQLLNDGNDAYTNGDYDKCIECYLKILSFGKPRTIAYAKLGLAYMKKININKAIDYLTIATQLSRKYNEQFDFTELIDSLKGNPNPDKKPKFVMKENDFQNDLDDNYGITYFDELNTLITETYHDVDSACEALNIQEEQKNKIKLLYAKLYYSYGEYEIGDSFILDVEKTKNKSKFIKQQIEIIKNSKKFYINREKTTETKLSLTLKPKK